MKLIWDACIHVSTLNIVYNEFKNEIRVEG
jgi:hypothetical protein